MGGYSGSMEITGVGVSDRLIDLILHQLIFLMSSDYSALLGC